MHCIMCIVFFVLYSMFCILCIVLYELHSVHCILCIVFYVLHLCIIFYELYLCIILFAFHFDLCIVLTIGHCPIYCSYKLFWPESELNTNLTYFRFYPLIVLLRFCFFEFSAFQAVDFRLFCRIFSFWVWSGRCFTVLCFHGWFLVNFCKRVVPVGLEISE